VPFGRALHQKTTWWFEQLQGNLLWRFSNVSFWKKKMNRTAASRQVKWSVARTFRKSMGNLIPRAGSYATTRPARETRMLPCSNACAIARIRLRRVCLELLRGNVAYSRGPAGRRRVRAVDGHAIAQLPPTPTPFSAIPRETMKQAPSSSLRQYACTKHKFINTTIRSLS
jgi:hypothetical protein